MSVKQNNAIVRHYFEEAWNKKSLAAIDEFAAPNYVGHTPFGEVLGPEQFKRWITEFTAIADYRVIIEDVIGEEDR